MQSIKDNFREIKIATHISVKSITVNFLLCALKMVFGLFIQSVSLISDGIHSLSDIFSTAVVLLGIRLSGKPADKKHPYGHEKIETVIALLLGLMLFAIGGKIGYDGIVKMGQGTAVAQQSLLNLGAMGVAMISIGTKEWMYRFTIKCANTINSDAMRADAWHHRTDALSSVGSLIGVIGLRLGIPLMDAIACLLISMFIFKAAYDIVADALANMVETTCSDETLKELIRVILSIEEVLEIDDLKTRRHGAKIYVDLEVSLDKGLSFVQSHQIASQIHDAVEKKIKNVKHCMVHVNPSE